MLVYTFNEIPLLTGLRHWERWLSVSRLQGSCCIRSWKRWVHLATGITLYSRMACFAILDCLVSFRLLCLYQRCSSV